MKIMLPQVCTTPNVPVLNVKIELAVNNTSIEDKQQEDCKRQRQQEMDNYWRGVMAPGHLWYVRFLVGAITETSQYFRNTVCC